MSRIKGLGYFVPLVAIIAASGVLPVFSSVYHSLYGPAAEGTTWLGFSAYATLFEDRALLYAFNITTLWALASAALTLLWAIPAAGFLYRHPKLVPVGMVLLAALWIVPVFIAAPIWRMFFHGNNGASLFSALIGREINLMLDPVASFLVVLFAATVHSLPPIVVVLYAGMRKTAKALVDAARVEGADEWQLFRFVHLPQLRPFLFLLLVVTLIHGFQEFTMPYLMTAGGPPVMEGITNAYVVGATTTLELYLYDLFEFSGALAIPSAYSTAFLVLFGGVAAVWYLLRRGVEVERVLVATTLALLWLFDDELLLPSAFGVVLMLVLVSALRWRRIAHMAGIAVVAFVGLETATAGILSGFQPAIVPALGLTLGLRRRSESRSQRPAATGTGLRYYRALRERLVSFRPGRRRGSADLHVAGMLWRIGQGTAALLYAVAVGIFLYLLLWISFSQVDSVFVDSLLPRFFGFGNYVALFDGGGFLRALGNSVMLAGSTALVATMISFMAGAAAAVFRHDGQSIFMGMEFFQLTGGIHSLVPLFALVVLLNAVNSYVPIVILYGAAAVPIGFYVLYGFLRQLPSSLYDAARIAGAGPFLYISRILLPLSRPALVNVVLLSWITAWNGFLIPLIFLTGEERFPVSVFLHNLVGTIASGTPSWGAFAAGSVVNILVLSILFVASRRPLQYDAVSELA